MVYKAEQDPYCYAGTSVLKNLADLHDQSELDQFELSMFLSRADEALPGGTLDYSHYRSIHRHLFQDVYNWAGEPRTIRIAKGGNWFCYPEHLQRHMAATFTKLASMHYLADVTADEFSTGAADVLAEINAGHPFREGNGRTQMTFLKVLALNAGYDFDDEIIDPGETMHAMIESFNGDSTRLTAVIRKIVA